MGGAGVEFVVTAPGETAEDVVRRLAIEIAADPTLAAAGVQGLATGNRLRISEPVSATQIDDPGLAHHRIPTLSWSGLCLFILALLVSAWWVVRRRPAMSDKT